MEIDDYISHLSLPDAQKATLRTLAADAPADLLGMLRGAKESFIVLLGLDSVDRLEHELEEMISPAERKILDREIPSDRYFAQGARMANRPDLVLPKFDVKRRDELLELIDTLKLAKGKSPHVDKLLTDAEAELDEILRGAAG